MKMKRGSFLAINTVLFAYYLSSSSVQGAKDVTSLLKKRVVDDVTKNNKYTTTTMTTMTQQKSRQQFPVKKTKDVTLRKEHSQLQKILNVVGGGEEEGGGSSAVKGFYDWYLSSCTTNPFVTKSTTCAIVCLIGDLLAQKLESYLAHEQKFSLNLPRLGTFLLCGGLYVGPFVHVWYDILQKMGDWMESKYGTSKLKQVIAQLFVDQTIGVAIFFPTYFYIFEYLESFMQWRKPSLEFAHTKCMEQISKVFLMQYRVFPLCNAINFSVIPIELRALFSNTVSLFWNIYLCTIIADH